MTRLVALALPLLLLAQVTSVIEAHSVAQCGPGEYLHKHLCCSRCPPGSYVLEPCRVARGRGECVPCEPGDFMPHPNAEASCRPCTPCRADQELVAKCSLTGDRQCQCRTGRFYCDAPAECAENCFPCTRCPEDQVRLRPCNATRDTVCGQAEPEPGNTDWTWAVIGIPVCLLIIIGVCRYKKRECLQTWLTHHLKGESSEPGNPVSVMLAPGGSQATGALLPRMPRAMGQLLVWKRHGCPRAQGTSLSPGPRLCSRGPRGSPLHCRPWRSKE